MNRADFLKNLTGAFIVTVIGNKLNILPDVPIVDKPGIGSTSFILKLKKNWFVPNDIIQVADKGFFHISKQGDKLLATCIEDPACVIELIEEDEADNRDVYKVCASTRDYSSPSVMVSQEQDGFDPHIPHS